MVKHEIGYNVKQWNTDKIKCHMSFHLVLTYEMHT